MKDFSSALEMKKEGKTSQVSSSTRASFDILSVGSNRLTSLQEVQQETMGAHGAVRNFFRVTEANDTETECHANLTLADLKNIVRFCTRQPEADPNEQFTVLDKMRKRYARLPWLRKKKNPTGWMCAQKRPFSGFRGVLASYTSSASASLPDYLVIVDDDTWVNFNHLSEYVPRAYPTNEPYVVAGCMIRSNIHQHNFTMPFGGFSVIMNRPALQNFQQPLHCDQYNYDRSSPQPFPNEHSFERLACWRLAQDGVGERALFRDTMSVADLMHRYVTDQPYLEVKRWNSVGFCMHSDWVFGYFVNYYHIARHSGVWLFRDVLHDRLRGYNGSENYPKTDSVLRQCAHKTDAKCTLEAHACHRISTKRMRELFQQQQRRATQKQGLG